MKWQPLSAGIFNTSLSVNTTALVPGTNSSFKLVCTDGFNTVEQSIPVNIANDVVIDSTIPWADAENVTNTIPIEIFFLNNMEPGQFTGDVFTLEKSGDGAVSGNLTYDEEGRVATFIPDEALAYDTEYQATLQAGLIDVVGNSLPSATSQ